MRGNYDDIVRKAVNDDQSLSLADTWRPPRKNELIGGGNQPSALIHAEDAKNRTGMFDPKYDNVPDIQNMRNNLLRGRDNEDDGDGTDENAGWDDK